MTFSCLFSFFLSFLLTDIRDAWCQNATNVVKPMYLLHPHTAPLDLLFYYGSSFPGYTGDVFVTQHGSWDRYLKNENSHHSFIFLLIFYLFFSSTLFCSDPPVGYRVSRIHMQGGVPVSDDPFFWYAGPGENGPNWHRPVGMKNIFPLCFLFFLYLPFPPPFSPRFLLYYSCNINLQYSIGTDTKLGWSGRSAGDE